MSDRCAELRNRITLAKTVLEAGSPLAAMEKGFSVVTDSKGKVIKNSVNVKKGERLSIRLLKGRIEAITVSSEQ
jgi:exodeoxyribonuclease VII large subunit